MGIKKKTLLVRQSVYWVNMNSDIKKHYKAVYHMLGISADITKQEENPM